MKKKLKKSGNKVEKVMHEFKEGSLKSEKGGKVKSPEQAITIVLSEARKVGADIPPNSNMIFSFL